MAPRCHCLLSASLSLGDARMYHASCRRTRRAIPICQGCIASARAGYNSRVQKAGQQFSRGWRCIVIHVSTKLCLLSLCRLSARLIANAGPCAGALQGATLCMCSARLSDWIATLTLRRRLRGIVRKVYALKHSPCRYMRPSHKDAPNLKR